MVFGRGGPWIALMFGCRAARVNFREERKRNSRTRTRTCAVK